jgi:hypothetical protein
VNVAICIHLYLHHDLRSETALNLSAPELTEGRLHLEDLPYLNTTS